LGDSGAQSAQSEALRLQGLVQALTLSSPGELTHLLSPQPAYIFAVCAQQMVDTKSTSGTSVCSVK